MSVSNRDSLGSFASTSWTLVEGAAQADAQRARELLGTLLQVYLPALRAYLRLEKGIAPDAAEDMLQGFVADKIVEEELLARADRQKGKFRSFLLAALNRYMIDRHRYDTAQKRAGGAASTSADALAAVAERRPPSDCFEIAWAQELVAQTLARMKLACERSGRGELWELFDLRVVGPAFKGLPAPAYEVLVQRFSLESPIQASNLLTTAKRLFARMLREVAGEYAGDSQRVEEEIQDLKAILSRAGA